MKVIRDILWKGIPYERKQHMDSHLDSMFRELNYLKEKRNMMLRKAVNSGWTSEILKAICILSVFNHYIIGPLSTSGKRFSSGEIENVKSISHGSMTLNDNTATSLMDACNEFYSIIKALDVNLNMLHSTNVRDIVYYISRENEDEGN